MLNFHLKIAHHGGSADDSSLLCSSDSYAV
uniref:Uncharacterized protein n=1 Tax=Anguilla anguilla TaxID=7936 RepID=A0A0E9T678_ANGAN